MARSKNTSQKTPREPGRLQQLWQVLKLTVRHQKSSIAILAGTFLLPVAAGIVVAVLTGEGNPLFMVLWIVTGVLVGVLLSLIVLGRLAERVAFKQIAGQPGAVGSVLKNSLRRTWQSSEMPIAVNQRTQDAVYRAVGKPGVVLVAEGSATRTRKMLEEEKRKVARILPNVPVIFLFVGPDADAVPLHKLVPTMNKQPKKLTKPEVLAASNRLSSLSQNLLPIPKGVDPLRVRAQRPR